MGCPAASLLFFFSSIWSACLRTSEERMWEEVALCHSLTPLQGWTSWNSCPFPSPIGAWHMNSGDFETQAGLCATTAGLACSLSEGPSQALGRVLRGGRTLQEVRPGRPDPPDLGSL